MRWPIRAWAGFFASFMSGNTTRLGVAFAAARYDEVRMAGGLILSFVAGAMVATVISRRCRGKPQAVMIAVTLLLAAAAMLERLYPGSQAPLLLAVAMGAECGIGIGVTYMTVTLVRMGQTLAGALMGDSDRWAWLRHLLLWLGFLLGVVTGGRCHGAFGAGALWLAAGAAGVVTIALPLLAAARASRNHGDRTPPDRSRRDHGAIAFAGFDHGIDCNTMISDV